MAVDMSLTCFLYTHVDFVFCLLVACIMCVGGGGVLAAPIVYGCDCL